MKCVIAVALAMGSSVASAQGWHRLPLPAEFGWDADVSLAPDGTPYLGYLGPGGNAQVTRWTGRRWEALGSPSCSTSWQSTLFFSRGGEPYYASRDYGSTGAFNVQRHRDGEWQRLTVCSEKGGYGETFVASVHDPAGMVLGPGEHVEVLSDGQVTLLPSGEPERVIMLVNDGYPESDPNYPDYPPELQDEYPTVVMGNEHGWRYLGPRRFSETPSAYLDMAAWEGSFWVVYSEQVGAGRITLKRYAPGSNDWVTAAVLDSTAGANTALTKAHGRLVVVTNSGSRLKAFTYDGSALVPLGGTIANHVQMGQQHWLQKVSCAIDSKGRLYVAYRREDGHFAVSRTSEQGGEASWTLFDESEDSTGTTRFVSMAVSTQENRVYVAYTDELEQPVVAWHDITD